MKITAKQYANALFESLKEAGNKKQDEIITNFANVLISYNHVSYLPNIINNFNKIWDKDNNIIKGEIVIAREIGENIEKEIKNFIKKENGNKVLEIEKRIDKNIKGGFVLRLGDRLVDASLKTRVEDLKNKMID
ncbi:F0F1 ATP synthase subunit delta [bacterium]|nr:F0F1 ATP synthase subunit delta [bacterium]